MIDPKWSWLNISKDGEDLVVRSTVATWFGSPDDKEDNGVGCAGFSTHTHPDFLGVSLPFRTHTPSGQFDASPIPFMIAAGPDGVNGHHNGVSVPANIVQVYNPATGVVLKGPVIDLGPSRTTHHGIDLTVAMFTKLGGKLSNGILHVDFRIFGAAKSAPWFG